MWVIDRNDPDWDVSEWETHERTGMGACNLLHKGNKVARIIEYQDGYVARIPDGPYSPQLPFRQSAIDWAVQVLSK